MRSKILPISFAILLPTITAIGAYYLTVITPLILICAVVAVTILVAVNKIQGKYLYFYLFGLSLAMVWQTTMMGVDVVGSDIHYELYYSQVNSNQAWDLSYPDANNTSIVVGILAPLIHNWFKVDMVWVYKVIMPIFLAFVPILLFHAFKLIFGEKRAYFATIFFVIIPVYTLEVAQIGKTMVAEFFLALMFLSLVSEWKWYYKLLGIGGSLILASICHYTIGIIGICFLIAVLGVRIVSFPIKWELLKIRRTPIFVLLISLICSVGVYYAYHSYAANGMAVRSIAEIFQNDVVNEVQAQPKEHEEIASNVKVTEVIKTEVAEQVEIMDNRNYLVKLGTGFDIDEVPPIGIVFRIIQYITQLFIIIGCVYLLFTHKVPVEYLALVGASAVMLAACILLPNVSVIINMTRFYHLSLFSLAPTFVLGSEAMGKIFP